MKRLRKWSALRLQSEAANRERREARVVGRVRGSGESAKGDGSDTSFWPRTKDRIKGANGTAQFEAHLANEKA